MPQEITSALILAVGAIAGFLVAWYVRGREVGAEKRSRGELKAEIEQLDNRFKAVASDVLRIQSSDFLKIADAGLDAREKVFKETVENLGRSVESVKQKVSEFEQQRAEQLGALGKSIEHILATGSKMEETAGTLRAVLSSASAVRGRWGEAVLKNLLEQSGLTEGVDFLVQETISGEAASLRPDVIINIPGGLKLAVDSKAGLEEFFKAVEEKDAEKKHEHISLFAQNLRGHVRSLASKEYQRHLDGRMPYVVMFIPGEAAVRAVFEGDPNLYREAQEKHVMLASPATIMPLILLIAHAWKQFKSEQNAVRLVSEVTTLGERLKVFVGHMVGIGNALSQANDRFNKAASSWDVRVFPQLVRIEDLGGNVPIDLQIPHVELETHPPGKVAALPPTSDEPKKS